MGYFCNVGARLWKTWMDACIIVQAQVVDGVIFVSEEDWERIRENRKTGAYQKGFLAYREHRMSCPECRAGLVSK